MDRRAYVGLSLLLLVSVARATPPEPSLRFYYLSHRPWFDPLPAEIRVDQPRVSFGVLPDRYPNADLFGGQEDVLAMIVGIGMELPLFGWSYGEHDEHDRLGRGFGWGIWGIVSAHILWDVVAETNPVVDTDYRLGVSIKAAWVHSDRLRIGLRFLPIVHSSSHLGDEYLAAVYAHTDPNYRRNVDHEQWDVALQLDLDWAWWLDLVVLVGIRGLYDTDRGFFEAEAFRPDDDIPGPVRLSGTSASRHVESYFGAEYAIAMSGATRFFITAVAEYRVLFAADDDATDQTAGYAWAVNAMLGFRFEPFNGGFAMRAIDVHARLYRGPSPFGHFRHVREFSFYGAGVNALF